MLPFVFDSLIVLSAVLLALFFARTLLSRVVCGELIAIYGAIIFIEALGLKKDLGSSFYLIPFAVQITVALISLSSIPKCRPAEFIYIIQSLINFTSAVLYSHKATILYDNYVAIMGLFDIAKLAVVFWYWRAALRNRDLSYHRGCLPWQTKSKLQN